MTPHSSHSSYVGALSPEFAILGFLDEEPLHGYQLHRRLVHYLGQIWHISHSQHYNINKSLEKRGDIQGEQQEQPGLPERRVFRLTEQGRQRYEAWLTAPSAPSVRLLRVEFTTRLFFTARRNPRDILPLIADQEAALRRGLAQLQATRLPDTPDQTANRLGQAFRLQQLQASLLWLDECRRAFEPTADSQTQPTLETNSL